MGDLTSWLAIGLTVLVPIVAGFIGWLASQSRGLVETKRDQSRLADRMLSIEHELVEIRAEAADKQRQNQAFQREVLDGVSALKVGLARVEEQAKTLFEAVKKQ